MAASRSSVVPMKMAMSMATRFARCVAIVWTGGQSRANEPTCRAYVSLVACCQVCLALRLAPSALNDVSFLVD